MAKKTEDKEKVLVPTETELKDAVQTDKENIKDSKERLDIDTKELAAAELNELDKEKVKEIIAECKEEFGDEDENCSDFQFQCISVDNRELHTGKHQQSVQLYLDTEDIQGVVSLTINNPKMQNYFVTGNKYNLNLR